MNVYSRLLVKAPVYGVRVAPSPSSASSRDLSATLCAILSCGLSTAVFAQGADVIENVVVTATRREESIQNVPFNIAALDGNAIQEQRLTNLTELTRQVPGLFLVDQGGRSANLLTVRGLNANPLAQSESLANSSGGTVGIYLGDIPLYVDLRLIDIERVEVLLGPQGTLYGGGTLGGAIRYLPNKPNFNGTTLSASTRSISRSHSDGIGADSTVVFNTPLIADTLAFRAAVNYTDAPGFIDYNYLVRVPGVSNPQPDFSNPAAVNANLTRKSDADWDRTLSGRAALQWKVSDAVEANLTYYYQDQKNGGRTINNNAAFDTGRYVSGQRFLEPNDRKNELLALTVDIDLGFAKLTSATGTSEYHELGQRDQTDLLLALPYGYDNFPSFAAYTREQVKQTTFAEEVRLVSQGDSRLNWIAGAFYNHATQDGTSKEFVPGYPEFIGVDRPDNLEYVQLTGVKGTEKAVFGEVGFRFTDAWSVTVGGRRFKYDIDQNIGIALPLVDGSAPDQILPSTQINSVSESDSIFKFNTAYKFSPGAMGYVTVSQGYRQGGANAIPTCQLPLAANPQPCAMPNEILIKPDTTTNYEIGLRSAWLNGDLVLDGALYDIEWKDIQVTGVTQVGQYPILVNGSKARSRGMELSMQARLSKRWQLAAGYSYTNAKLTHDAPGIVGEEKVLQPTSPNYIGARNGDRLPGSPEHQGYVRAGYSQPLGDHLTFHANYRINAFSNIYTKAGLRNFGEALGGFALHSIDAGVSGDRWTAKLYVDNLFDKYAETSVRGDTSYIRSVANDFVLRKYYKGMVTPLTFGLDLSYNFNL